MADPRFFVNAGPFTLGELARRCGAELSDAAGGEKVIADVAPLETAGPDHLSFLDNRKYLDAFAASQAGACLVRADLSTAAPAGMVLLRTPDPYRAYAKVAAAFYPEQQPPAGIAPGASVDASAVVGAGCRIETGAVVAARAEIGPECHIGANATIGEGVVLGRGCIVGANASILCALIGDRVRIYPGARIGQEGFGFAMGAQGHLRVPQLGRVIIGDDVEVGANSTVNRGSGPDTVIGAGCMIDNLVQIGHNVQMGRGCVLAAQVGISGSTRLEDFVAMGGQVGLAGHLRIGAGARIAAQSGVMRDVAAGATVCGAPAIPNVEFFRQQAALARLGRNKGR